MEEENKELAESIGKTVFLTETSTVVEAQNPSALEQIQERLKKLEEIVAENTKKIDICGIRR